MKKLIIVLLVFGSFSSFANSVSESDCRSSYSKTSFYSESIFIDKISCLKDFVVASLNLAIESGSLKKSVHEDTKRLVLRLTNVNEILFLESIGCGGGALAFVSSNPSASNYQASTISFCPNTLQQYQRAFMVKHNQEQVEDIVDTLLINILVHEGLHLVGYKHSKELYKTIYNIVSAIGFPSIHKKKNGNQSKWLEGLFAKNEDGSILMSKEP